jgi:hypothetical protein
VSRQRAQVLLMQPLLCCIGEKGTLIFALVASVVKWTGIGLALSKMQVFAFDGLGALAFLSLPMISSLKANAIGPHEQGALQGALSGLQALSSGFGPLLFMLLWQFLTEHPATLYLPRVRSLPLCMHTALPVLCGRTPVLAYVMSPNVTARSYHEGHCMVRKALTHASLQGFPLTGAVLSLVPLLLACRLDVRKLQEGRKAGVAENTEDATGLLTEAAAPEGRDCSATARATPLENEQLPAGHHVMQLESGWAHTEGDFAAGLLAEGEQLAPPAAVQQHAVEHQSAG